ncbi:MAG: hypothetical protein H6974_01095 [Gammaproteobacteria bacterium]|nr:hypothetical protein [Gammaproteobacteria bacterium]MCP5195383.1 hypothetical protein [Gammaproteobacteria bacterium]
MTAAVIKKQLDSVGYSSRDDEARKIINSSTPTQLQSMDAKSVLLLILELRTGWISDDDNNALDRLKKHSQFQPVPDAITFAIDLLKNSMKTDPRVKAELAKKYVTQIYAAEEKRLSTLEQWGIDGDTIGRGQLSNDSYQDVTNKANYLGEFEKFLTHIYIERFLDRKHPLSGIDFTRRYTLFDPSTNEVRIPPNYQCIIHGTELAIRHKDLEDFVVAAYLTLKLNSSFRNPARPRDDALKIGVGVYHGMFGSIRDSQIYTKNDINWAPIEADLLARGGIKKDVAAMRDHINYIYEVIR